MTDIASLNTVDPAENGAFMQLRHPITDDPLFYKDEEGEEQKTGMIIRGNEAPSVQKYLKKANHSITRNKRGANLDKQGLGYAKVLVMKFVGCFKDGRLLDADDEADIEWFFKQSPSFVTQTLEFAEDSSNFFKLPESD